MHYVKHFDILGVDTAQIPCIELQGVPNTATEGAIGLLGINILSDEHELYVCVAVNGSVYTWKPLNKGEDGVSVVRTELNEDCELIITLSDGTTSNLGKIKGEKGEKGEQADLTKIQEKNEGRHLGVWLGKTKTFEQLNSTAENTVYLFEDDDTLEKIEEEFTNTNAAVEELRESVSENSAILSNLSTSNTKITINNGMLEVGVLDAFSTYVFYSDIGTYVLTITGQGRGRSSACFTGNKIYDLVYESGVVTVYEGSVNSSGYTTNISTLSGIEFRYYKLPLILGV